MIINTEAVGRIAVGVKTPIIKTGDNLTEIVIDSCLKTMGEFHDGAAIGVTEAVVAIAQGNYATPEDIQADIARKYPGESEIMLLFPIQSRNRFMNIPKAIAAMPQIKKIYVALSYPTDEVGNRFFSDEVIMLSGTNLYQEEFSAEEFYERFGAKPMHPFTKQNYIELFEEACAGKAEVILSNNIEKLSRYCKNVLVCTIRKEQRKLQKKLLKQYGVENCYDLSEILNEPINGSGYSPEYGLYGSNMMAGGKLKLMPRDSQVFVELLQKNVLKRYGKKIECLVYGDGAFKDPVGGIWELADPETTLGATEGFRGTPQEVKLKLLASMYTAKSGSEIEEIVSKAKEERIKMGSLACEQSLGTTPRQKTDLFASWADLTTGSGDEQTPVVYTWGFIK